MNQCFSKCKARSRTLVSRSKTKSKVISTAKTYLGTLALSYLSATVAITPQSTQINNILTILTIKPNTRQRNQLTSVTARQRASSHISTSMILLTQKARIKCLQFSNSSLRLQLVKTTEIWLITIL